MPITVSANQMIARALVDLRVLGVGRSVTKAVASSPVASVSAWPRRCAHWTRRDRNDLPHADSHGRLWCAETSVRRGPGHRDGRRGMIST